MKSPEECLAVAASTAEAARILASAARNRSPRFDASAWILTMDYYVLRMYLKALELQNGEDFDRHQDLKEWINGNPVRGALARPYRMAENWSREARYEGRLFSKDEFSRFSAWFVDVRDKAIRLLEEGGLQAATRIELVTSES